MSNPFLAEIRIFAGNFAPSGWAQCNGQTLPITQNTALFSLVGTYYGGDGISTFGLPNLQGSAAMHWDQGPGLSPHQIGESGGEPSVTLLTSQLPAHSHAPNCVSNSGGNSNNPALWAKTLGAGRQQAPANYATTSVPVVMNSAAVGFTGGNLPHNNMQPYLALTFIIALQGIFPSRS